MHESPWSTLSEADKAQFWASLALKHSQGIGPRSIVRLLQYFGSAYAALEQKNLWEHAGLTRDKAHLVGAGSWRTTALEEWQCAQECGAHILLWHHNNYPISLRSLIDAPSVLYYKGDISLLSSPCIAIVGSRHCSAEGVQVAGAIARELSAAGISIVSGVAQGIDRVAHAAALTQVGKSVGVLGTGIDIVYPKSNADMYQKLQQDGLLISEFAPKTKPLSTNFPIRNRIVSGLCLGVLVVEGKHNSGSLITARLALEQNREVYAVPGATTASVSQGCQELIRQGAKPVFNGEDILHDLAPRLQEYNELNKHDAAFFVTSHKATKDTPTPQAQTLKTDVLHTTQSSPSPAVVNFSEEKPSLLEDFSPQEQEDIQKLLLYLHEHGETHTDILCEKLKKPISYIATLLIEMELIGLVKKIPGARYVALQANI